MNKSILILMTIAFSLTIETAVAQQGHCATMDLLQASYAANPALKQQVIKAEGITQQWIAANASKSASEVITIPVVFHIIHDDEAIGTGNNVSDEIVLYQLSRINEDFRKMNADTLTPASAFYPDQADCEIEFCLAERDPFGNPTTGIIRHNIDGASWTINEIDSLIKPATIWNRYDYVNFWCVNLDDPDAPGVDGYATFPTATTDSTDGVVVATFSFGYIDGVDKSITATHELGHFFNLSHIWGDDFCGDDLVADTPTAEMSNSGCPDEPYNVDGPCNPGEDGEMFMNYMDYSDAECVVMFSNGQKTRMQSAISTFRSSLTTSNACTPVSGVAESLFSQNLNIYPNPAADYFVIEADQLKNIDATVSLYNQVGVLVKTFNQVNDFPFVANINNIPGGVYYVKIVVDQNTTLTRKIVIAN